MLELSYKNRIIIAPTSNEFVEYHGWYMVDAIDVSVIINTNSSSS